MRLSSDKRRHDIWVATMSLVSPTRAPLSKVKETRLEHLPEISAARFPYVMIQVSTSDWNSFLKWQATTKPKTVNRFWRTAQKPKLQEQTAYAAWRRSWSRPVEALPIPDSKLTYITVMNLGRRVNDQLHMAISALRLLKQCRDDKVCLDLKATERITAKVVATVECHVAKINEALWRLYSPGIRASPAVSAHYLRNSEDEYLSLEEVVEKVDGIARDLIGCLQMHHDHMELIAGCERPFTSSLALDEAEQALIALQTKATKAFDTYEWPLVNDMVPGTDYSVFGVTIQPLLNALFAIASSSASGDGRLFLDVMPLYNLLHSLGVDVTVTGADQVGSEMLEVNLSSLTRLMSELGLTALPQYELLVNLREKRLSFYDTDTIATHCTSTKVPPDMYHLHREALVALANPPLDGFEHFKQRMERYMVKYQELAARVPTNVRSMQRLFNAVIRVRKRFGFASNACQYDQSEDKMVRSYGENCRAFHSGLELSMFIMTPLDEAVQDVETQMEQFMNHLKAADLDAGNTYSRVLDVTSWVRKRCKPLKMWLQSFHGQSDIVSARTRKHLLYSLLKVYQQATEALCSDNALPIHMKRRFLARIGLPWRRKKLDPHGLSIDLNFVKADCDELLDTAQSASSALTCALRGSLGHFRTPRETMIHILRSQREEDGMVVFDLPSNSWVSKDTTNSSSPDERRPHV